MRSSLFRAVLLIVVMAIAASGCNKAADAVAPTPTVPVAVTETFAGALAVGGVNYHFLTAKTGDVIMAMKGIGPDPTMTIGMAIGVYNTTSISCTDVMGNATATIGSKLVGIATASTSVCVKVYDAGTIPADTTMTYELTVIHY